MSVSFLWGPGLNWSRWGPQEKTCGEKLVGQTIPKVDIVCMYSKRLSLTVICFDISVTLVIMLFCSGVL